MGLKRMYFQGVETTRAFNTRGQSDVFNLHLRLTVSISSLPVDDVAGAITFPRMCARARSLTSCSSCSFLLFLFFMTL